MKLRWVAAALCVVVVGAAAFAVISRRKRDEGPPNIVLILLDDADKASVELMPNIRSLIADRGMTFERAYVTESSCCPSRASILTGDYVHNHGVLGNRTRDPGGYAAFAQKGHEERTFTRNLQRAGYSTGLFGKYFNLYGPTTASANHVPPYWDSWVATFQDTYYDWMGNDNGTVRTWGDTPSDYATTVFGRSARRFIKGMEDDRPFFIYNSFTAPHFHYTDPPDHDSEFANVEPPSFDKPSFDEADMSDKPKFYRQRPRLSPKNLKDIRFKYTHRLRLLLGVDDYVKRLVSDLEDRGELDNTYIFVTSDNGWMQGEHRRPQEKAVEYEESIKMPFFVRGPGIEAGSKSSELISLVDLFATFVDISGGKQLRDGRSLVPLLKGTATEWRDRLLVEWPQISMVPSFGVLMTDRYKYVRHGTGEEELYDLEDDPYEVSSAHASQEAMLKRMRPQLDALEKCKGASCRTADGGPPD
jgi:arylsulfatase A-like enzyme